MSQRTKFVRSTSMEAAYDVRVQAKPGARWRTIGVICRYGHPGLVPSWNALAPGFSQWTPFRPTRKQAAADMFAGIANPDADGSLNTPI